MKFLYKLTTLLFKGYFHIFYKFRVYGAQGLPPGAAILAANHASFFDPPLIAAVCPEDLHFLARASLFKSKFAQWLLPKLNAHPIEGTVQDRNSLRMICQLLQDGNKVLIFPEGMRSATGDLQPIKSGVAMLAMRAPCPIIPVYLQGTFAVWPRNQRWPSLRSAITCVFGKPIYISDNPDDHKKKRQEQCLQQLQESLNNLRLWAEDGATGEMP